MMGAAALLLIQVGHVVPLHGQTASTRVADDNSKDMVVINGTTEGVDWRELADVLNPAWRTTMALIPETKSVISWEVLRAAARDSQGSVVVEESSDGRLPKLIVDRALLRQQAAVWKQQFAEWRAADPQGNAYRFERISSAKNGLAGDKLLVIAGYQSQPGESARAAKYLSNKLGWETWTFAYPTDGQIDSSARQLASLLQKHRGESNTQWHIVAHSMGGIVARAAIELHEAVGVARLIQVFPPNHGCVLAEIAEPLDGVIIAKNQLMQIAGALSAGKTPARAGEAVQPASVMRWLSDGFALGSRDLCPASELLAKLNALPREKGVQYSIIAGRSGPLHPLINDSVLLAGPALQQELSKRLPSQDVNKALDWLERLVNDGQLAQGRGDGVVSLKSTQLAGVDDYVVVDSNHIAWSFVETEMGRRVMDEVLMRLRSEDSPSK
jgi:pimeloyl-ACP methyl ester carboxylesterase